MKNILALIVISTVLLSCVSNQDSIISVVSKDIESKLLFEQNELKINYSYTKAASKRFFDNSEIELIEKIYGLDSSLNKLFGSKTKFANENGIKKFIKSKDDLLKEITTYNNINPLMWIQRDKEKIVKCFNSNILDSINKAETEEIKLLFKLELINISKGVKLFFELLSNQMHGNGMVVTNIEVVVSLNYGSFDLKKDSIEINIFLNPYNKNIAPNIYLGKIDETKIDTKKEFTFSKPGEFSFPPLEGSNFKKIKTINSKAILNYKTSELKDMLNSTHKCNS
tara:strand:+ start:568 stop:1413 length:846 start_codon:yes stop_codon:yes gene_type:complete